MEKLLPIIILVPVLIFWLWMARDMINNDNLPENLKHNWTLAFAFLSVFAAMLYYTTEYKKRS